MSHKSYPKYRKQKSSNGKNDRAFVEINSKRIYLGEYDSPESREKYYRLMAEYSTADTI